VTAPEIPALTVAEARAITLATLQANPQVAFALTSVLRDIESLARAGKWFGYFDVDPELRLAVMDELRVRGFMAEQANPSLRRGNLAVSWRAPDRGEAAEGHRGGHHHAAAEAATGAATYSPK
jgi:hypothetical protein